MGHNVNAPAIAPPDPVMALDLIVKLHGDAESERAKNAMLHVEIAGLRAKLRERDEAEQE